MNSFQQWWLIHSKGINPVGIWTTQQLKDGMELAWNEAIKTYSAKPTLICSRCGVDRLSFPCPTSAPECKIAAK